jgi:hypothetical protein
MKVSVKGGFAICFVKRTCPFKSLKHNYGTIRANSLVRTCRAIINGCLTLFSKRIEVLTRFADLLTNSILYKCSECMAGVADW